MSVTGVPIFAQMASARLTQLTAQPAAQTRPNGAPAAAARGPTEPQQVNFAAAQTHPGLSAEASFMANLVESHESPAAEQEQDIAGPASQGDRMAELQNALKSIQTDAKEALSTTDDASSSSQAAAQEAVEEILAEQAKTPEYVSVDMYA